MKCAYPKCENEIAEGSRPDKRFCCRACKKKNNLSGVNRIVPFPYIATGAKKVYDREYYRKYFISTAQTTGQCGHCGDSFARKTAGKKYCCQRCRELAHNARNKGGICTCATCSTEFNTTNKRKYCSIECNPHIRVWDKNPRICATCSNQYIPIRSDQKHCSMACVRYKPHSLPHGTRLYNTKEWQTIRATFIAGYTIINGISLSNKYCLECYRKQNRLNDMHAVDHIIRVKDGGTHDHSNLQSLCRHHHQSKSAQEGNSIKGRNRGGRQPRSAQQSDNQIGRVVVSFATA